MDTKLLTEFKEEIEKYAAVDTLPNSVKLNSLYAWVEQKVHNQLVRDYNRDWQCPICGAEKPAR